MKVCEQQRECPTAGAGGGAQGVGWGTMPKFYLAERCRGPQPSSSQLSCQTAGRKTTPENIINNNSNDMNLAAWPPGRRARLSASSRVVHFRRANLWAPLATRWRCGPHRGIRFPCQIRPGFFHKYIPPPSPSLLPRAPGALANNTPQIWRGRCVCVLSAAFVLVMKGNGEKKRK